MPTRLLHPIRNWRTMDATERRDIRNQLLVLILFSVIWLTLISLIMYSFTVPLRIAAPFVFSQPRYEAEDPTVCPGETLKFDIDFTVQRAPIMVLSVSSIWDVERNQAATLPSGYSLPNGGLAFVNYTETTHVSRSVQMDIPPLDPGVYERRTAVQEFDSQAAAYSVRFEVPEGCP